MIEAGKLLQQRYRIDRQIGQGGMGAVYIATDQRFGSTVAIKETLFMDDNYRKAIEREARLLNSLRHPALPRVSDHFAEDNGQFLVMEYIPGEDLSHMLESSGKPFAVDDVLRWADQLLDALDFLHNQSMPVVHRDIKPQNLKLASRGQIILLDFGLAKGNPTDAGHQTAAKSIFGYSRNYASLEQIQGTGTDPRSDLYSLAATLYHLLTGVPPEDALTRAMAVLSQRPDPLVTASTIRHEIPLGVSAVLAKALDLNADGRPSTAAEMRTMLREHPKYEHLVDISGMVTVAGDVHAQPTRLMPGQTLEASGQTDVKTRLMMPQPISAETEIRNKVSDLDRRAEPADRKLRRRLAIWAVPAVIVLAATAAGIIYVADPFAFGVGPVSSPAVQELSAEPPGSQAGDNAEAAAAEVPANTSSESEAARPRTGSQQTTAASPRRQPQNTNRNVTAGEEQIFVDERTGAVYVGNVKIDEDGVTRSVPRPPGALPFPDLTREQLDALSPEARQKLIEARRRILRLQREHRSRPFPVPTAPERQP
ncbi:MAG: serine/threonine protein kinase [Pyrinomonadaceae bacterium]